MKRRSWAGSALASLVASCAVWACGDDDSTTSSKPLPPPELSIVALESVGGPSVDPATASCVEVGRDPAQTIAVLISVQNFTLRPPGACGSLPQCGTAVLRLDPAGDDQALLLQSSKTAFEVPFEGAALGSHTFRVELRGPGSKVIQTADAGGPLSSEVTLEVSAAGGCSGASDAGADAPEDAADAGADAADAPDEAADAMGDAPDDGNADAELDAGADAPDDGMASADAATD